MGADCKSAGLCLRWFKSNILHGAVTGPITTPQRQARPDEEGRVVLAGVAQLVELQPSKLNVAGSNPVSRSRDTCPPSSVGRARPW